MKTTITNSNLTATFKNLGAELCSIKDTNTREYIWQGNPKYWARHAPILFPIVGSLKNNVYQINKTDFHLLRHGFARDLDFKLIKKEQNTAVFLAQSSNETLKSYPYQFNLEVIYTLDESTLYVDYKVTNTNNIPMPFSIGAHPAFALPNAFENYSIEFEKQEYLNYSLLENNLISNQIQTLVLKDKKLDLNYGLFQNDALVFKIVESKSIAILENKKPFLKINFEDFPNLGIWTKIDAPFLCIEPWFGYSDSNNSSGNLFEKEGIQILDAGKTFRCKFNIHIFN